MDVYIPAEVYTNLIKMLEYRGATLSAAPLNIDEFVQKLNHYEFVTIMGTRPATDPRGAATIMIILIAPDSKYSNKSPEFKKLLKGINVIAGLNIVFISEYELTTHIKKTLIQYKIDNEEIYIEHYDYEIFMMEIPRHESVPEHIIAPNSEIDAFCAQNYIDKGSLPKILQTDPQAVWLGLRPGMCVKIIRLSETACKSIIYRICVRS